MSSPGSLYTVACLQTNPAFGEVEANLDAVEHVLENVRADLLVLPELFATGYSFRDKGEALDLAEPFPGGPTVKRLAAWSQKTGGMIVAGYAERDEYLAYNAAAIVADGVPLKSYRKSGSVRAVGGST